MEFTDTLTNFYG